MDSSSPAKRRQYKPSQMNKAEDPDLYRPGGLYPLQIGETLKDSRYKILHKLGFGSWSTVWLARDQLKSSYVSVKIVEGAGYDPHAIELEVSHRLEKGDITHPGRQFTTTLLDEFVVEGPNGKHQCYVTKVAGPTLTHPKSATYDNLKDARVLVAQVYKAIQYIHSCGVIHGDLHPDNVLLQLDNFDQWSEEELYNCVGNPVQEKIEIIDPTVPIEGAAPAYLVHPLNPSTLADRLLLDQILLIDFGTSFFFESIPPYVEAPAQYAPPELLYKNSLSPAIDQWTLGCLLFEICTGYCIFKMMFNCQNDVMKDTVSMIGRPPERMWKMWEERGRYFEEDGTPLINSKKIPVIPYSLKARIIDISRLYIDNTVNMAGREFPTKELEDMYDLLEQMLVYEPASRLSLDKCLEHPFLAV